MPTTVRLDEESIDLLDKYCRIRPSTPEILVGRIAREWYARAAKEWHKRPELIPKLPKLDELKSQGIDINTDIGKSYKKSVELLNKKLDMEIDPDALLSWLAKMFIKAYNIKYMTKRYREQFGRIWRK